LKLVKLLYMLMIGFSLAMAITLIGASPAIAIRDLELDPDEGRIGDNIDIDGENWPPSDPSAVPPFYRYIDIYFTSEMASTGDNINDDVNIYEIVKDGILVDTVGNFSARFSVPSKLTEGSPSEDVRGGVYYICVTYENDKRIRSVVEFTVRGGEITTFSPTKGAVGTEVEISGEDFGAREEVAILYDGDHIDIERGDDETDNRGRFDCTIVIPPSIAGKHTITIQDETRSEVEEIFTVEPKVEIIPTKVPPGNQAKISGTGFGNRVNVEVFLNGEMVASGRTGRDGDFTIAFTVPDADEGIYEIEVEDDDGNEAKTDFTAEIGTQVNITPVTSIDSPGHVGQNVTIGGEGFRPDTEVIIIDSNRNISLAVTTSDANGDFIAILNVPAMVSGPHTINVSDGVNSANGIFYIESVPPPIPQLISPATGTEANAHTEFDWDDVKDVSGVTYELQIATASDFNPSSIIIEATGLTKSEYSEILPPRSGTEPYYWRIRAVDGASNASGWSMVSQFSVGFIRPSWTVHLWWGIGVAGAFFLAYRRGQRSMYY